MTHQDTMSEQAPEMDEFEGYHSGFVALAGKPNVGKSTIMNEILGVKLSITTDKPQTTRNRILGVRTFPEKGQIGFVDTPGIHRTSRQINREMVRTAVDSLRGVDVVCHVLDVAEFIDHGGAERNSVPKDEQFVLDQYDELDIPIVLVLNKDDKVSPKEKLLPVIELFHETESFADVIPTSALEGENVDALTDVLLEQLPEGPPLFPEDMLTDRAERFFAAEFVREELMRRTRQEVPYGIAVEIDTFAEKKGGDLLEISAVIHVEKKGQKGIVIGKGGEMIKEVGIAARKQLEEFFGRQVHLETFVRVEEDWSENEEMIQKFL